MAFVQAKCTNCGGILAVDNEKDAAICEFCGTPFVVEKAVNNYVQNIYIQNTAVNSENEDAEHLLRLADNEFRSEKYKEAEQYYTQILKHNSDNIQAWMGKGNTILYSTYNDFDYHGLKEGIQCYYSALNLCNQENDLIIQNMVENLVDVIKLRIHSEVYKKCFDDFEINLDFAMYFDITKSINMFTNDFNIMTKDVLPFFDKFDAKYEIGDKLIPAKSYVIYIYFGVLSEFFSYVGKYYNNRCEADFSEMERVIGFAKESINLKEQFICFSGDDDMKIQLRNFYRVTIQALETICSQKAALLLGKHYEESKYDEAFEEYRRWGRELYKLNQECGIVEEKKGGCYVATCVYGSYDCPEVWTLRRFRDYTLDKTWYGRLFIKTYYATSPIAVKLFGRYKWFKNLFKAPLNNMVNKLKEEGYQDTPYSDKY